MRRSSRDVCTLNVQVYLMITCKFYLYYQISSVVPVRLTMILLTFKPQFTDTIDIDV